MINIKLSTKILISFLILSFIPIAITQYFSMNLVEGISSTLSYESEKMNSEITQSTKKSMEELGTELIKQKAIDIAKQLELYIEANPDLTLEDLKNDESFRSIAIQPIGLTGYSAFLDANYFTIVLHKFPGQEGKDLFELKETLPAFWDITKRSEGGKTSFGYYDWMEVDGTMGKKYAYIAPVNATTADGRTGFTLWATTYIDEFSQPTKILNQRVVSSIKTTIEITESLLIDFKNLILSALSIFFILILSMAFILAKIITQPIDKLREASEKLSKGNLDVKVKVRTKDEIGQLASSFNKMAKDLKKSRKDLEEYSKTLEKQVAKRTKELKLKIDELEKFNKLTIGRELKMIELKDKIREIKKTEKNKPFVKEVF